MAFEHGRLGVRAKLLLVFALPVATCVMIFGVTLAGSRLADTGYKRALDWSDHALVETDLRYVVARYRDAVIRLEFPRIDELRDRTLALAARSRELAARFVGEEAEEAEVTASLDVAVATSRRYLERPSAATREVAERAFDELDDALVARVTEETHGSRESAKHGKARSEWLLSLSGLVGAGILVFGIGVAVFLTRRITRSLRQLEDGAREFAAGKWDSRLEVSSSDELGKLARTFNEMASSLQTSMIHESALEATVLARTAELRASTERHRMLFDLSPIPICVFREADGGFVAINYRATQLFGYTAEEIATRSIGDIAPDYGDGKGQVSGSGVIRIGLRRVRCKNQSWLEVDMTAYAVELDGVPCVLLIGVDVTEARKLEAELRQTQKLEGIGQLAGGIAHDFNNILAAILAHAELAREQLPGDCAVCEDLDEIVASSNRAAALTRQLLAFSRKQPIQPKVLELDGLVTNIAKMLGRLIGATISLNVKHAPDLGWVNADAGQLEQVLTNLVVNARDAMPSGGKVTIETQNRDVDARRALALDIPPGSYVTLSVTDTGTGIDDITRARMFEPFFTTKGVGKGTGLGLATVFGIVKQNRGAIEVTSKLGDGATFRIYLPRVAPDAAGERDLAAEAVARGRERILVVDDEVGVRTVLQRRLAGWGYEVQVAEDGPSALALLARTPPVQLVLVDLVMPGGLTGQALCELVRQHHPETEIICMTGHSELQIDDKLRRLMKPFSAADLATAIRAALDPRAKRRSSRP